MRVTRAEAAASAAIRRAHKLPARCACGGRLVYAQSGSYVANYCDRCTTIGVTRPPDRSFFFRRR
jgi:hypothetical protein